jgi:hypothetical protein
MLSDGRYEAPHVSFFLWRHVARVMCLALDEE